MKQENNIKQIYSLILRRDLDSMKTYFDEKRAKAKEREVDLGRLYLNWNKLVRGY